MRRTRACQTRRSLFERGQGLGAGWWVLLYENMLERPQERHTSPQPKAPLQYRPLLGTLKAPRPLQLQPQPTTQNSITHHCRRHLVCLYSIFHHFRNIHDSTMSDQFAQMAEIPKEFMRDGTQFINRCTKRTLLLRPYCLSS